jgi:hypothetical protein
MPFDLDAFIRDAPIDNEPLMPRQSGWVWQFQTALPVTILSPRYPKSESLSAWLAARARR